MLVTGSIDDCVRDVYCTMSVEGYIFLGAELTDHNHITTCESDARLFSEHPVQ